MKKLLFVCDEDHYPQGGFEWIRQLHQQEPCVIKGLFFTAAAHDPAAGAGRFIRQCGDNAIQCYTVEKSHAEWQKTFWEQETRYADLLVFSQDLLYAGAATAQPNERMQDLLRWATCPVIAVPEDAPPPEHIIAAYDGSSQSMEALKTFCTLFPWSKDIPAQIVYIKDEPSDSIPQLELLTEYAHVHFTSVKILKLRWDSDKHFNTWVGCFRNPLLVTGAFGRSALSTTLRGSFIQKIIGHHLAPVFVAR
ncbi:hypothetical protein [Niabella drilacis]|uniref:Universal stress protein family protein n=1 Tax=Niabella drilacis (strain DSM 25811 / CCM 8410 / CCUG 62505 / LMG 26954 / E90) TaxID=1285928 RepID=A0A1G6UUW8_NIADE|nr:hypothetical protein [Niabella drilacis]SDD45054.1 hypothetical protein SAMN04487894_10996 [Niabella drilacis]